MYYFIVLRSEMLIHGGGDEMVDNCKYFLYSYSNKVFVLDWDEPRTEPKNMCFDLKNSCSASNY